LTLKLAQRERSLQMGIDLVEWTYDPLQALNAHLNFTKLGVVVEEYEENIYGASSSPLHSGSPTDRFVAEWKLTAPHVERRIAGGSLGVMRDASVASRRWSTRRSRPRTGWRRRRRPLAGCAAPARGDPRRLAEMMVQNPPLALEWRMASRAIFQHYFARGYRAVDFFLSRERSGTYLRRGAAASTSARHSRVPSARVASPQAVQPGQPETSPSSAGGCGRPSGRPRRWCLKTVRKPRSA
jgi:predicted GNAT superfamily acetyltransferase